MTSLRSLLAALLFLAACCVPTFAQKKEIMADLDPAYQRSMYRVLIDLKHVNHDRVNVQVFLPAVTEDTAVMVFPQTIPGTYERQSWYRYIESFTAFDSAGAPLPVRRSSDRQFVIDHAKKLAGVAYQVNDSFDDRDTSFPMIFPPAGTDIQADSIFVLNHAGFIGYLDGYAKKIYQITVLKPTHLYGATALQVKSYSDSVDMYSAANYDHLVDNPVMYSIPDTVSFTVRGTRVLIACASTTDHALSAKLEAPIKRIVESIGSFLGTMPVDRYAFLVYCWNGDTVNVATRGPLMGALEHNYCSFYFWHQKNVAGGIEEVATHEFLHILEPLNLHSEEIESFDFRAPKMSKHLWLYEGVTEYFSDKARVHDGAMTEEEFHRALSRKLYAATYFPAGLSLTTFSKDVLSDSMQEVYPLIYEMGPIVAMGLDVALLEESKGERGLLSLIRTLSAQYGPSKPFKDDELWTIIEKATSPAIRDYCMTYIEGSKRVDMASIAKKLGWIYTAKKSTPAPSFGIEMRMHGTDTRMMIGPRGENPMGVQAGDELTAINGRPVNMNDEAMWMRLLKPTLGDDLTITVKRNGESVELTGKAVMIARDQLHVIENDPKATPEQLALRKAFLFGS